MPPKTTIAGLTIRRRWEAEEELEPPAARLAANIAPRSARRTLVTPPVDPGSRYRCSRGNYEQSLGHAIRKRA